MPTTILPSGQVLRDYSNTPAPPPSTAYQLGLVRSTLVLLMDQIDYTTGACPARAPINSLIKPDYLDGVRNILEMTNERSMDTNRPDPIDLGVQRDRGNLPSQVSCVPTYPSGVSKMKTLAYTVAAWVALFMLGMFLVGFFTPAPAHAGSCTATKGRNTVCRPSRPICWPPRHCA